MEHASAPAIADFKRLSRLVKKYRKIYETQYQAIRNKTLAHTEIVDDTELAALYAKTNIRDLERLLIFLNKFHKALWELLQRAEAKAPADAVFEQKPHADQDGRFA